MSASDKKKLRKEQASAFLTEKQMKEQAEAKKLRTYTITFITAMVLIVCITVGVLAARAVNHSGVFQKNTIAAVVGDHQINSVELSYYYSDKINEFYNDWYEQYSTYTDTYLNMMGLNTSKPLNEQVYDQESGKTWAQYFIEAAVEQAKSDYALYELAINDKDFKLPEDEQKTLDNLKKNLDVNAVLYGFSNGNQYLRTVYGYGSDVDSYYNYSERSMIASAYYNAHNDSLKYDANAIDEYQKDKKDNYNSYDYSYSYLSYTDFRTGGTKGEDGNMTYTDKENNDARDLMKATAEEMATAKTLEELKKKAEAAKVNEKSELAVNTEKAKLHTAINAALANWLAEAERKDGDIAAIPNTTTVKDEDGKETTLTNGYYVAIFNSKTENKKNLANVRHLLVKFTGGTEDEETGEIVYSAAEKDTAKVKAEGFLKTWKEGEATEETFIELVKKNTDDSGSKETGGLYEDITPASQYVTNFLNWSISDERQKGDTGIIETEYGYHVMYYVGDSDITYRDYMITNEMREADQAKWYEESLKDITTSIGDTSKMALDMVLSAG